VVGGRREKVRERSGHEYGPEIKKKSEAKSAEEEEEAVRDKRDEKYKGFGLIT